MEIIGILVVGLLCCALVGKWAASKGRSAAFWFFASLLLSPLIGALLVALATDLTVTAARAQSA